MKYRKTLIAMIILSMISATHLVNAGIGTSTSEKGEIQKNTTVNKQGEIKKGIGTGTTSTGEIKENKIKEGGGEITYGIGKGVAIMATCKVIYEAVAPSIGNLSANNVIDPVKQSPEAWNQDWIVWDHVGYKDRAFNGERHIVKRTKGVQFLGYAQPPFDDMMLRNFGDFNRRTISVIQSPVRSDWHTINGSGIVFNAKLEGDYFTGNAIVATQDSIELRSYARTSRQSFLGGSASYSVIFTAPKECPGQAFTVEMKNENKTDSWTDFKIYDREELIYEGGDSTYGTYAGLMTDYAEHDCESLSSTYIPNFIVDGEDFLKEKIN